MTRNAFLARLKNLLHISEAERLYDSFGLVDQGVDTPIAIATRDWSLEELGVDVPTLNIVGGRSDADLTR